MATFTRNTTKPFMDFGLLLLRSFLGLAMLFGHGLSKWKKLFGDAEIKFADPFEVGILPSLSMAVFAEVICSIFLIIGLFTRWSLIPLIITMFVAAFVIHVSDGFNVMEKALLYGVGFFTLLLTGPGKYSFDALIKRTR